MKYSAAILATALVVVQVYAQTSLTITPNPAAVSQGETVTFTSNQPVTWALVSGSSGSLIQTSPTQATYQAPATVIPQGTVAGCQTTPSDSVYNTPIANLPVEARSASWIANMGPQNVFVQPDFGTNVVDGTTPQQQESFLYTPQNNALYPRPDQIAVKRQNGSYQTDLTVPTTDKHEMNVDTRSCMFYEMYKRYDTPRTQRNMLTTGTSGVGYSWSSYSLLSGTTQASNMLYHPTRLKLHELQEGEIRHALSFTAAIGYIHAMSYWPANSTLGCPTCQGAPYGARFRLKSTFDISKFSPDAQIILRALQQYGMFLTDAGSGAYAIYGDTDLSQDPVAIQAINQIGGAGIKLSAFDVVDESSFIVDLHSNRVNPANPYQPPANYAILTATPKSGATISLPIALGAKVPGVESPTLAIVAGTPLYQLHAWVGGSSDTTLMWKLLSGPGSVTSSGVYLPPASVSAPTKAILQAATCSLNPVSATVAVTVLPNSPDGSLRIDAGSSVPTRTADGKSWLADIGYEGSIDKFGTDPLINPKNPAGTIYRTFHYTNGDDITYRFGVPNGNYRVRLLLAAPYNGHQYAAGSTYDVAKFPNDWGPYHLIANGQIAAHNFDFGAQTGHVMGAATETYLPAKVTDNRLTISIRGYRPDSAPSGPEVMPVIQGLEIMPDANLPHLAIDTQQTTTLAAGKSVQLYAIGWYMDNAVEWNIVLGPGTVDQSGLYTAPLTAGATAQRVVIQATSKLNGHISATTELTIPPAS